MYGEIAADSRVVSSIADIVDALDTGVIVLDGDGVATSANDAACRILGVPDSAVVGRPPPYLGDCQAFLEDEAGRDPEHRVPLAVDELVLPLADLAEA